MELEAVRKLKKEILNNLHTSDAGVSVLPSTFNAEFEAYRRKKNTKMLAVGYSKVSPSDYALELRVRSRKGSVYELAKKIKEEVEGQANIATLSRIRVPYSNGSEIVSQNLSTKQSPFTMGCSVGTTNGKSGSIGGFLIDIEDDKYYALSCNHVIAECDNVDIGEAIHHPGPSDAAATGRNKIGVLSDFIKLKSQHPNEGDSAIAELDTEFKLGVHFLGNVLPDWTPDAGMEVAVKSGAYPSSGEKVYKVGRTTGFTSGSVNAVSLDGVEVEYQLPTRNGGFESKVLIFDNVIEVIHDDKKKSFATYGDSGSLVYTKTGNEAKGIGLIFAGASYDSGSDISLPVTLCCSLKNILEVYKQNNPNLEWLTSEHEE